MNLNDILSSLRSVYDDWSPHLLANNRVVRLRNTVAWADYDYRILEYPVLASKVREMAENGQYSFQSVTDGALFQLSYRFDQHGQIISANLVYYQAQPDHTRRTSLLTTPEEMGLDLTIPDDIELYEIYSADELTVVGGIDDGPVGWLRIDYAPEARRGVLHYDCHMHLSAFPHARFIMGGLPNPRQFVELLTALFYPDIYKDHRLNHPEDEWTFADVERMRELNRECIPLDHDILRYIIHIRVPTGLR